MLGFSEEFIENSKVTKVWLNFTLSDGTPLEYHEDRVLFNGFVRDTSTTVDGEFTVGAAVTSKLSLHLDNSDDALSAYDFRGATVVAWLGGSKPSTVTTGLHPDEDVVEENQFTITGLTQEQLALFEVGGQVAFGMEDGYQDVWVETITAVSTTDNVTTITVEDEISISAAMYVSILVGEKVNAGRYYVDEYTYDGSNVSMVAYDDMCKFDVKATYTFPAYGVPLQTLLSAACTAAGLTLGNHPNWNRTPNVVLYKVPAQWDTMTWHDVVAAVAQICCCYAHIVYVPSPGTYTLALEWYDTSQLTSNQYDGGTFDTDTTPYSDGASLDGGSFNPWNTGDAVDGGAFGDRSGIHIVESPYDLTVDTDDVMITGVSVTLDPSDNKDAEDNTEPYTSTVGSAGYIVQISGNPLIVTTSQTGIVANYIYNHINGMRFRPLNASCVEDPSMEAGDVAIVTGRNANMYSCFLSRVTYSVNAATQVSCDAVSTMQNLKARYSEAQKTQAMTQQVWVRSVSTAERVMSGIVGALSTVMGLYDYSTTTASGTTYLFGNADTLAASDIRWRFTAGALMVSSDYGQTWNAALSANGIAVLQEVYAVKVNADYIETGTLTVGGTDKGLGSVIVKDSNDNVTITMDTDGIHHGKTGINDVTNTGFYLNDDGFIIGDGTTQRYMRVTPDGTVYIHDNPFYDQEESNVEDPSFFVEGPNKNGNIGQVAITSSGITVSEKVGNTVTDKVHISSDGNVYVLNATYPAIGSSAGTDGVIQTLQVRISTTNQYLGIRLDGGLTFGVNLWQSDESLKKDIKNSKVDAISVINQILHRSFEWKRNGAKISNGYVAQELEKVIPGSTYEVEQADGTSLKQIDSGAIIPYLSKAIQELSAKVDALEARLAELEGN